MLEEAITLLYIDDDPDDLMVIREALNKINPDLPLHEFKTGSEAFDFLEAIPEEGLLPSVVILDLNMPGWDGIQTLKALKEKSSYQHIPVCIFTNSDHADHMANSFSAGASQFITKPYNHAQLMETCFTIVEYTRGAPQVKKS